VSYRGAGTIEMLRAPDGAFYFLEMNTRLQVEHPVTECVTGLDLVEWQLRVAAGERLPLAQHEIRFTGHAIEARLYAEDPYDGFRPQTGRVTHWRPGRAVAAGRGSVRIDDGLAEGQAISPFYDAMVAKVIVHGRDRDDARLRLRRALEDAPLLGLVNNGRYLCDLLQAPDFAAGTMTTTRLDEWAAAVTGPSAKPAPHDDDWRIAAAVLGLGDTVKGIDGPRAGGVASRDLVLDDGTRRRTLRVRAVTTSSASAGTAIASAVETTDADVTLDGRAARLRLHAVDADGLRAVEIDGLRRRVLVRVEAGTSDVIDAAIVVRDGAVHRFAEPSPYPSTDVAADASRVLAPVAGTVAQVRVRAGDRVAAGDPLVCVEAMKMELWLPAAAGGVVVAVHAVERASVAARALLVELLPD
jgi:geranyl-CoA carboxylase alpha subunit